MTPTLKKIIIVLILAVILFVIYALFLKKDPTVDPLVTGSTVSEGNAQMLGEQISQALLKIEQIKLDKDIFSNVLYRSLVDRSEPILDEPIGRPNPFAPIGDISSVTSVSKQTSTTTTSTGTSTKTN